MSNNYLTGLAGAIASDVTRSLETDPVQEKINKLQERTQEKLNRLGKQDYSNTMSDLEFQTLAGKIIGENQVIRDEVTGDMYQVGLGGKRIPFEGDAQWMYQFGSKSDEDATKVGIAQDVIDGQFVQPERRYTKVPGSTYGWESGPQGVDLQDRQMGILLPKEDALMLEGLGHARQESQQDKMIAGLEGADRKSMKDVLGGGYTEFYKDPTGFWGDVSQATPEQMVKAEQSVEQMMTPTKSKIGSISKKYESGGDVSAIAPDSGGTTSYGTYQMNSAGTMQDFLKSPEGQVFGKHLSKYEVGSPEFNATYQKIAKSNSGRLAEAQDKYIQRTHFEPITQMAEKAGIDVQDLRVQEALWSQSVQHSPEGNAAILKSAINMVGVDAKPEELVQAMYVSRNNYVQGLTTIDDKTKAQLTDRYANEMNDVLSASSGMSTKEKLIAASEKRHAGSASEYVDRIQGSLAKVGADAYNMVEKLIGKENIDTYNKFASDVEKYFGGDGDVGYLIDAKGDIKGTDKNIKDFRDREVAAKEMGVTQETLDKHNAAMASGLEDWEKAETVTDHIKVMARMVPEVPGILAESAGEMAGLFLPGGIGLVAATRTSNYAEEFKKNNDREMTPAELARTFFGEMLVLAPEKLLIKSGVAGVFDKLAKGGRATKIATAAGGEALQEYGEGITEAYATQKVGERTLGEIATAPEQTFGAALGGITGGGLASTGIVRDVVPAALEASKKGIELATETETQKQQRIDREFTSPKRGEALNAAITGDHDMVIARVEEIHGRLSDVIDSGASQRYTYRAILNDALNTVAKVGNPKAAENVYKTIAALDANPKVEFKAKDILDKEDNELVNKFLQLVNKPELSKTAKVVGVSAEDTMAEIAQIKAEADARKESRSRIFGSDIIGDDQDINEAISKLADDYMKAKGDGKALEAVNDEFARLGFIIKDGKGVKADPNRPGLKRYKDVLTDALIDSKKQNTQLDKKLDQVWGVPTFGKLKKFAESRVAKLGEGKRQNNTLLKPLVKENSQMIELANELEAVIDTTTGITPENKAAYKELLNEVSTNAEAANAEVAKRQAVIQQLVEAGVSQEAADKVFYDVAKDGAVTLQISTNKVDGKRSTKKIADVSEDGKLTLVDGYKELINGTKVVNEEITQETIDQKVDEEVVPTEKDAKPQAQPDEVMTKDKFKEEYVQKVKKLIKEKTGKLEELTLEDEQLLANAAADGILDLANKELIDEATTPQTKKEPAKVEGPLAEVRAKVAKLDKELADRLASVQDMEVKQHVKEHYNKKLTELQKDKSKLEDMLNRYEALIAKRQDKTYSEKDGVVLSALKMTLDKLLTKMIDAARKLKNLLKGKSAEYNRLETELKELLQMINEVEKPVERKTTIGKVKVVDEDIYGKPLVEVGEKRVVAEKVSEKTGKDIKQATAINQVLNKLAEDKIVELRDELKSIDKGKTSLGAKLVGRLLKNYPMQSPVHNILKRTNDSVFGQIKGNTFADTKLLLDTLPKGFKEFFAKGDGAKELLEDFEVMKNYINGTRIGDILISKDRRVYSTSSNKSNIDKYGLIMKNITSMKDGIEKISNFPIDIIELIGTVKDGKLEIDEQTQNILKFYSAKLFTDTQRMVGLILSMDESEMGQVLGIYDADEQLQVKQDARDGYINSASVRGDIGKEVYQALGIKFNETTPEFTEESFIAALGVLVQAIAIENGSVEMKSIKSTKNRNLIKTVWENVPAERNSLIRAVSKLQYMNENRSRPLPSTKKPADRNNRTVMNTQNPIDAKSNEFINKQEKIAYRISPKLKKWLELDETDALKAMGYIDVENADLHASETDAVLARNDKLVREWNILKTFANGVGDKKFYLNWGQTVSGRFTILNDINYQESKLHREFVVAEGSTIEVDPKSEDGRQMLEASILQGLDMDPDKLSAKTASEKFNKLFKVTDKGIEVTPYKKDKDGNLDKTQVAIKQAYDAMKKGEFDADVMAEVFADSEGHHGLSSIELLVEWDKAIRSGEKIKTHANLEIDAITSGMILTLLQIGSDEAVALAEKGGIYTKEGKESRTAYVKKWLDDDVEFTPGALIEAGKKHAAEIEAKIKTAKGAELTALRKELENDAVFKDLYSTIGVAMIGEVQAYKEKLLAKKDKKPQDIKELAMLEQIGELNLKNIRSIAKSPVMVFIYGATITSIKKKLTYSLGVDTLVKAMKTASKLVKTGKDAAKELEFIKQFEPAKGWLYTDGLGGKIDKPEEQWKQLLYMDITPDVIESIDKVINATFGTAIETAFESRLGFVNKNRDAIKTVEVLMFEAYQIRLSDAVTELLDSKYGKGRHKGETYKISKEELQDINARLTEQGYGHNIVWNDTDGSVVNQTLNKTGEKGGKYTASVQVGDVKVGGQIKEAKPAVNTGAAPTISIHAIDGRMMLDVLNREVKGYTGGNVYDAVVLSLDKAMLNDTANTYNTNMIETGFSRSILADQLTALENMLVTMSDSQKKRMFTSIGLRPEGQLKEDYTNEVNRLKLGTGKMLELLEIAEEVNKERLANSANGYSVGHLFQMGAGVVDVEASETRAKTLPVIDTIKRLLENRQEQDRKITEKEFGVRADYVFNTNDIIKGETQIESKANIAQISTGDWVKTTDPMWGSLSSKDTVTIIGEYILPEKADSKSRAYNKVISGILKSNAGILDGKLDKELLKKSGRQLINGVWVKTKAETKVEEGTLSAEQITKLKEIFMNGKGELKSGMVKLVKELKLDMKDC